MTIDLEEYLRHSLRKGQEIKEALYDLAKKSKNTTLEDEEADDLLVNGLGVSRSNARKYQF